MMIYAPRMGTERRARRALPLARSLRDAGGRVALVLLHWHELARQRRRLLALDDRMLKDIGITRTDARREGARPFWDARGIDWGQWP